MILTFHGYNEDLNFVFVPADGNTARKLLDGGWAHPQELIRFDVCPIVEMKQLRHLHAHLHSPGA